MLQGRRLLASPLLAFTLIPCTYPNQQGNETFGGGHQRYHCAVVRPLVCSHDGPGLAERTGKLLTAITRQRKLLTLTPLALKTEIAFEIWEVCH